MGKVKDKKLESLVAKLKKKIKPERIILFGSRARGDFIEESDYDILIVSDFFKGMSMHERMVKVLEIKEEDMSIEPICLTKEEFENLRHGINIVREATKEGVELKA